MSLENEALRRCERLLALMSEAMDMERTFSAHATGIDASTRSVIRPILEQALARLEPLLSGRPARSLTECVRELIDLELELDAALAARGWRVLRAEHDDAPPVLNDRT
jgi:hypothetical protein